MNTRKPILTVNSTNQAAMYFTTLWNLFLWSTLYKDNKMNLFILAIIIGLGIEFYNKYNLFHMSSEPIIDEVNKTHRQIPPAVKKYMTRRNPFECTLDFDCKVSNQEINSEITSLVQHEPSYSIIQVKWTIGEARIKQHLQSMFKLFDSLENKISTPGKPSEFKTFRQFLPHRTYNFDMPTKSRYLIYTGLPAYFAGASLADLFNLTSSKLYFKIVFAIVSCGLNIIDSYHLNTIRDKYRLEGFNLYVQDFFKFPWTCIGGQLTRKIEFDPRNSLLTSSIGYIMDGEVIIQKIKEDDLRGLIQPPLDYKTSKLLESFEPLIEPLTCRV